MRMLEQGESVREVEQLVVPLLLLEGLTAVKIPKRRTLLEDRRWVWEKWNRSQDGKFSYGYASSPRKRSPMEDFYEIKICGVDGEMIGLFEVFDGHVGARAAEYVKQNLFRSSIQSSFIDTKLAIADAYNHTDSEFLKYKNNQNRDVGSTASTAVLVGDRLVFANFGDSRVVNCRGGNGEDQN